MAQHLLERHARDLVEEVHLGLSLEVGKLFALIEVVDSDPSRPGVLPAIQGEVVDESRASNRLEQETLLLSGRIEPILEPVDYGLRLRLDHQLHAAHSLPISTLTWSKFRPLFYRADN